MTRLRKLSQLMNGEVSFPVGSDKDVATLRQRVLDLATRLGFSAPEQISIVTAVSQLALDVLERCGNGDLILSAIKSNNGGRPGIQAIARTLTPVFPAEPVEVDPDPASDGLAAARRIVDELVVASGGQGSTVTLRKWPR